jgi:hypothetical protein
MKIEDISNQLAFVGNLIIDWLDQLLHPFKSMTRIFEDGNLYYLCGYIFLSSTFCNLVGLPLND